MEQIQVLDERQQNTIEQILIMPIVKSGVVREEIILISPLLFQVSDGFYSIATNSWDTSARILLIASDGCRVRRTDVIYIINRWRHVLSLC